VLVQGRLVGPLIRVIVADSPIGIAGYFLDHDARSLAMISRTFDGQPEGLTRDDVLDNVTLTWLTNSFISGARLYWEDFASQVSFFGVKGVSSPGEMVKRALDAPESGFDEVLADESTKLTKQALTVLRPRYFPRTANEASRENGSDQRWQQWYRTRNGA
jgi:hypothetical protein